MSSMLVHYSCLVITLVCCGMHKAILLILSIFGQFTCPFARVTITGILQGIRDYMG